MDAKDVKAAWTRAEERALQPGRPERSMARFFVAMCPRSWRRQLARTPAT